MPDFIKQAQEAGITIPQLLSAEKELDNCPCADQPKEGMLAKKVIDAMVHHRKVQRPWRGPLPAPRVSPPRTFGDVLASAKVCRNSSPSPCFTRIHDSSSSFSSPAMSPPAPEMVQPSRSVTGGDLGRNSGSSTVSISGQGSNSKSVLPLGLSASKGLKRMWLRPSVPYRPTTGLAALFSRTGTRTSNPRAPHSAASRRYAISYATVARVAMERGDSFSGA